LYGHIANIFDIIPDDSIVTVCSLRNKRATETVLMVMKTIFLTLSAILLIAYTTQAQGDYLQRGENALEFGVFIPVNEGISKLGGIGGFSINGMVDLGLSFRNAGQQKILYAKSVTLHLLRQGILNVPFGISFRAGTTSYNMGNLFSENIFSYGPILYRNIRLSNSITIQPSVGLSLLKDNSLDRNSDNRHSLSYDMGLSGFWKIRSGNAFKVSLGYSLYNSDWVGESGDKKELRVQAAFIIRSFGGKRVDFKERREIYPRGNSGQVGLGLTFVSSRGVTGAGLSLNAREPQLAECNLSGVFFSGGTFGVSSDIAFCAIKGGTGYGRPGICLLAGASSVEGYGSYDVGLGLYGDYFNSEETMIQPTIGIAYFDGSGVEDDGLAFLFSLSLLNEIKSGKILRIDFGSSIVTVSSGSSHNNNGTIGFSIGVMFGKISDSHDNDKKKK